MIVRLGKEQQDSVRRQLSGNRAYAVCHDVLRQMLHRGETGLSPAEVFMSARNVLRNLFDQPDIGWGLDDTMDDLEDETDSDNDFTLIMAVATVMLQDIRKNRPDIDAWGINSRIIRRLGGSPLLWPFVEQASIKEEFGLLSRTIDIVNYSPKDIEARGDGAEAASGGSRTSPEGRKLGAKAKPFREFIVNKDDTDEVMAIIRQNIHIDNPQQAALLIVGAIEAEKVSPKVSAPSIAREFGVNENSIKPHFTGYRRTRDTASPHFSASEIEPYKSLFTS